MAAKLFGKVVLISGGGSMIGAALAQIATARGAKAVLADVETPRAKAAACGGLAVALDPRDSAQWDAAINTVVSNYGRLDGLVLIEESGEAGAIIDLDLAYFRRCAERHVEGAFLGAQKAVAQMRKQTTPAEGAIVAVSSILASNAASGFASYAASKAALSNMMRALGVELGRKGDMIRVNTVSAGPLLASNAHGHFPERCGAPEFWVNGPLKGLQEPEDIAESIAFLLSDEASFITAAALQVDGGWNLT